MKGKKFQISNKSFHSPSKLPTPFPFKQAPKLVYKRKKNRDNKMLKTLKGIRHLNVLVKNYLPLFFTLFFFIINE